MMKKFITYEELIKMQPHLNGFDADNKSRCILRALLEKSNWQNIVETSGNNSTDIIATNLYGTRISIEAKDRSFGNYKHNTFNDHIAEDLKVSSLIKRKSRGEFKEIWLTSFYIDGVIKVTTNIDSKLLYQKSELQQKTTTLTDHTKEWKLMNHYLPDALIYFYFEYDNVLKDYVPRFSKTPINIQELNNKSAALF